MLTTISEETMKTRLLVALAGLAIGVALPTFAQKPKSVDPQNCRKSN